MVLMVLIAHRAVPAYLTVSPLHAMASTECAPVCLAILEVLAISVRSFCR